MNIHLHHVIADITGVTGQKIGQSILNGEREPRSLASRIYTKKSGNNEISFDRRARLYQKTGVDLTRIDGINASTALTAMTEIGFSIADWKTERHLLLG